MEVPEEADGPGDGYDLRKRSNSGKSGRGNQAPPPSANGDLIHHLGQQAGSHDVQAPPFLSYLWNSGWTVFDNMEGNG